MLDGVKQEDAKRANLPTCKRDTHYALRTT